MGVGLQELVEGKRSAADQHERGRTSEVEQVQFVPGCRSRTCRVTASSLIELNPLGGCTVRIATISTIAMGTLISGTSAPMSTAKPPMSSVRMVSPGEDRGRHVQGVQDAGEVFRTARELGIAVLHEPVADDEAQRQRPPGLPG